MGKCIYKVVKSEAQGWVELARAVVTSGEKCRDETFLEGEWCESLREWISDWDRTYERRQYGKHNVWF